MTDFTSRNSHRDSHQSDTAGLGPKTAQEAGQAAAEALQSVLEIVPAAAEGTRIAAAKVAAAEAKRAEKHGDPDADGSDSKTANADTSSAFAAAAAPADAKAETTQQTAATPDSSDSGTKIAPVLAVGGAVILGGAVAAAGAGSGHGKGNHVPVANPDTASATENGPVVTGNVATNDTDKDAKDVLTYSLNAPVAGLTLNPNGTYSFDPSNAAYNGLAAGQTQNIVANYTVNDGHGGTATSTLTITITGANDAPVSAADSYSTAEDTTLTVAAPGVLANDSDPEGSALTAALVSGPAHGTLTLNPNGSFSYTPTANYTGPDSFTYRANDGTANGNTVTVSLNVTPVNDAPVSVADSYNATENVTLTVNAASGVLANDSDVDGNALTAALVSGPAHGTLTLNPNGSFSYTPAANYSGPDSFTYRANDGTANGNTVTVSLNVAASNDAPVSAADSYSTNEDTVLNVAAPGVLANDTDGDGDPLTAALVTGPAHGSLTLNPNGSFSYTPAANYSGADSFTYRANDGTTNGNTVTVSLTVNPINDAPVAAADSYTATEDTTLNVSAASGVLANDSDPDGNSLTAILVGNVSHGSLTLNPNGSFSYTPAAGYNGPDSFTYKVNDGTVDGNTVTVSINVGSVNDVPVATGDSHSVAEDNVLNVAAPGVLGNDTDADGDPLTAVLVSGPTHAASFTLNADGSFSYTPAANYNGPDSFTYKANDGTADSNIVTVNLTVTPVNDVPVSASDSYSVNEDSILNIAAAGVLANDSDVDGNALTAVLVSGPTHGSLTLNPNGSFSYTPVANYNGPDTFTYKANDGSADGNTVTVNLTVNAVNDAPVASADSFTVVQDTPLVVAAASGVLANDSDVDGDPLTALLVSNVAHGTLTLNANGSFTYTPASGYTGPDSFTYKANDGTVDGNTVTVSLNVAPPSQPPVAAGDSYSTSEDSTLTVNAASGVLANDSDPDGDPLTAVLVTGPAHGSLTLNPDGSFSYTPAANYNGPDSFTYKANDGTVDGNTVTVSLTVNPVNDPPAAAADSYSVNEDSTLTVAAASGVLANDSDADGNSLTAILVSNVTHGALNLNADGSFSYTPAANYNGPDSFTYKVNDGTVDGNTVTVNLTVNPVNDVPVAAADNYNATVDTALTVPAASGVLANDSDVDGDPLTAILVSNVAHGTLVLNANGSFSYTPAAGYAGADSFTYKVNDGTSDGNTVTVSLNVAPAGSPPVAVADNYSTNEDTTLTVSAATGVLANDTDADGNSLTAVLVSNVAHGSLTLNPDGSFSYTPAANYSGPDSFTYKANDGTSDGNTVTVNLTVNPVNDAPSAVADSYSTAEDTPLSVAAPGVLANDSDPDGNSLTAVLVTGPSHAASFTFNPNGSFNYTPVANYNGPDSFTYKANDGTADGNIVTVSLTVTPVNDVPVSTGDSYSTNEDTTLTVAAAGVLANDTDIDGNPLTAALVTGPAHGSLTLNPNGSFSYTPTANYNGADSFTYKANDGTADGNTVTVNLTVNPVNDPPVANDDTGTANEDLALTVNAASGVLSNDTDADGNSLSVATVNGSAANVGTQITLASGALLTLNANGSYVYNPNGKFEALRPGQTGTDSFSYTATDGTASDPATVTITIQGANEVPTASPDTYNGVTGNTPYSVAAAQGVLANDTDPDQPASGLSVTQVNGTAIGSPIAVTGGTVTMNANGSFTFVPATGFQGTASFNYTVTDADGGTDVDTVTINVTGQVWYVDASYAGANGPSDGSYLKPFTSLTELNGVTGDGTTNDDVDGANDTIFVYNTGTYNGGIVLENGQQLFGDSHTLVVNGITVGANAGNSTINHSGTGITLASGNTVDGTNLVGTAAGAIGIQDGNASVGTATISNSSITGQGQILDIDQGGTINASFSTLASTGSTGANGGVIDLTGVSGTLTVSGATTINGTHSQGGIDLTGNTSLTVSFQGLLTVNTGANAAVNLGANTTSSTSFTGGVDIDTTSGVGLAALGGNAVTVTGASNSINTSTGQILSLSGATMGAGNIAFATLGASGVVANTAINLNNLDGTSFTAGTVSIGGTSGAASDGIFIGGGSSANFSFGATTIGATGDEGIEINGAGNGTVTFTSATVNGSAGNGVEISGATSAVAINGGAIGNTDDPAGDAVNITGGTAAVTIAASISKTTAGNVVEVNNHDSGNLTFSGNISGTGGVANGILVTGSNGGIISFTGQTINLNTGAGNGIDLTSNAGATLNFNPAAGGNGIDIVTTSGTGFNATGGGTLSITGSGNSINAGSGAGLTVQNTTIAAGGLTFQSISSGPGANNGITLDTTGANAGLTITGTGTANSGGVISAKTGADGSATAGSAIYLNNTRDISLTSMDIEGNQNYGIRGINVVNFALANSTVGVTAKNGTTYLTDTDSLAVSGEASVRFTNLTGTGSITGSTLDNGIGRTVHITTSGVGTTLNMTVANSTIRESLNNSNGGDPTGNTTDALFFDVGQTSTLNLTVDNVDITAYRQFGLFVRLGGSAQTNVEVKNSDFSNSNTGNVNASTAIQVGGGGTDVFATFNIHDNTFRHGAAGSATSFSNGGAAIVAGLVSGTGTFFGRIVNNVIGVSGVPFSGAGNAADAMRLFASGNNGSHGGTRYLVQGNTIQNYGEVGIQVNARQGNATIDATIIGNTIRQPGTAAQGAFGSIWVNSGALPTDTNTVNIAIGGTNAADRNTLANTDPSNATDIFLDNQTDGGAVTAINLYRNGSTAVGSGEALVRQILVDDNIGPLDLLAGFTNGSPIGTPAGLPLQAPLLLDVPTGMTPGANIGETLTSAALADAANAAIARWEAAGATSEQLAAMRAVEFSVAALTGLSLGESQHGAIQIDDNGGGYGWFIDATPGDDREFANGVATADGGAAGRVDLLSVIMHELGHQAGLIDNYNSADSDSLMYGMLGLGERHAPDATDVAAASGAPVASWVDAVAPLIDHGVLHGARDGGLSQLLNHIPAAARPAFDEHAFGPQANAVDPVAISDHHAFGWEQSQPRMFDDYDHRIL